MKTALLLIAASLLLLAACGKSGSEESGEGSEPATPVQVATAQRESIERIVNTEAILYPVRQASVVPKITAPVARFLVQRGDHVREGQLLAVLEDRDLAAAARESQELYRQAQANYENLRTAVMPEDAAKAKADVNAAQQAFQAARKVSESRERLFEEGALARKLVDDAKVALAQAQAQYDTALQHLKSLDTAGRAEQLRSAQAQMDAAKAHYESSAAQLAYAEVRSPISGVVSDRPINLGELASSGAALISIVDISRVIARANIPVQEAAAVSVGRPATISGAGGTLNGKVTVVSPAVDPNTTTVQVWVEAPNPGEVLKPGTTVQISIDAGQIPGAVVVPASALLASEEGGEKIMAAGPDGLAHEHDVQVGVHAGDNVQILSGIQPGDRVITQGALGLDDKSKIQIGKPSGGEDTK